MSALFRKLQLKDRKEAVVVSAPKHVLEEASQAGVKVIDRLTDFDKLGFALIFVSSAEEVTLRAKELLPSVHGDPVIWFAYPKRSSKRYRTDIDRDHGWEPIESQGFAGVAQVAVDEDWSAVRFRRVEFIGRK